MGDVTHGRRCWHSWTWRSKSQWPILFGLSKPWPDEAVVRLSSEFDCMHLKVGQASGRPEGLLRAFLFISLYSVRAERVFCEEIEYNLLYRWFLDMYLMKHSFDPAVFTKNRRCLLQYERRSAPKMA